MENTVTDIEQPQVDNGNQQDDPTPKLSVKDFAAKIKAKYPEYKDIDDVTLSNKIVAKYPEYKDVVDFGEKKNLGTNGSKDNAAPLGNGLSDTPNPNGVKGYNPIYQDLYHTPTQDEQQGGFKDQNILAKRNTKRIPSFNEAVKVDNTYNAQPQQAAQLVDYQQHNAERIVNEKNRVKEAIGNTAKNALKNKGVDTNSLGVVDKNAFMVGVTPAEAEKIQQQNQDAQNLYNQKVADLTQQFKDGKAAIAFDKKGKIGLAKTTGFIDTFADQWNKANKQNDDNYNFVENPFDNSKKYDAILVAVGHDKFKTLTQNEYDSLIKDEKLIIDVKGIKQSTLICEYLYYY